MVGARHRSRIREEEVKPDMAAEVTRPFQSQEDSIEHLYQLVSSSLAEMRSMRSDFQSEMRDIREDLGKQIQANRDIAIRLFLAIIISSFTVGGGLTTALIVLIVNLVSD